MWFKSFDDLKRWLCLNKLNNIGSGSQGQCYKIGDKVYKIFYEFIEEDEDEIIDEYLKEDILKFSFIDNDTYVFPNDIIMVDNIAVGYICDYVDAKSLYKINPLLIDIDRFLVDIDQVIKDIKIISDFSVLSYDVMYNILYGECGFKVIDTMEYTRSNINNNDLFRMNKERFFYEIRLFLLEGYFDKFILDDKYLYGLCYDVDVNFSFFLKEFKKKLSEFVGFEITKLGDAKECIGFSKKKKLKYLRDI